MNTTTRVRSVSGVEKRKESRRFQEMAEAVLSAQKAESKCDKQPKTNEAFKVLTHELLRLTWSVIRNTCTDASKEDMDDVYQNINLKLFKNLTRYDGRRSFVNWYVTLCQRTCIDWGRKSTRHRVVVVSTQTTSSSDSDEDFDLIDLYPSKSLDPAQDYDYNLMKKILAKTTQDFVLANHEAAEVIRLKQVHIPNKEIAVMTERGFGQVRWIVLRWRRLLRKRFAEAGLFKK